jgi:hypothetical protein
MRSNPYIRLGLQRAGFTGGWLSATEVTNSHSLTPERRISLAY